MSNFKKAAILKLRFNTEKGLVSAENLFELSQSSLAKAIKEVKSQLKETEGDDELGFLTEAKSSDPTNELRFNILKEVYLYKKEKAEAARNEAAKKEKNQEIYALIQDKKKETLKNLSVEELEKLIQA